MESYEKKYKNALKEVQELYKVMRIKSSTDALNTVTALKKIFPELAESGDEKVRKTIIRFFKDNYPDETEMYDGTVTVGKAIAWLEKQHTDPYNGVCFDCYGHHWGMCVRDNGIEIVMDGVPVRHFSFKDCEQTFGGKSDLEAITEVKVDNSNSVNIADEYSGLTDFERTLADVCIGWIGEEPGWKQYIKDNADILLKIAIEKFNAVQDAPFDYENATIVQKNFAPKEPKFKVGDWIANGNYTWKIVEVKPLTYVLQSQDGNILDYAISYVDELFHSFTIEDAKDGDVLVNCSNIFIFHFIYDTRLMGYCHVNTDDGRFYEDIGKNECICLIDAVVTPATKEQRGQLEKAMADAGYAFDFEKKELMKIKQKTAQWSEEDDKSFEECCGAVWAADYYTWDDKEKICDWLKSLKERMKGE